MGAVFTVIRTDTFLAAASVAYTWIFESNFEISADFNLAERKANELFSEIDKIVELIAVTPEIGRQDENHGFRHFPVYEGRYSLR